jgi:hypothetical protein
MRMPLLSCCLLLLVLAGCAGRSPAPAASSVLPPSVPGKHLQRTLVDVRAQRAITFDTLVEMVAETDVVAIGAGHSSLRPTPFGGTGTASSRSSGAGHGVFRA